MSMQRHGLIAVLMSAFVLSTGCVGGPDVHTSVIYSEALNISVSKVLVLTSEPKCPHLDP